MPDQTPSMPPLPGALLPLIRGAAQCTGPAEDVQMAYITAEIHAYAQAVADERVREALEPLLDGYRRIANASDSEMRDGDLAREIADEMLESTIPSISLAGSKEPP